MAFSTMTVAPWTILSSRAAIASRRAVAGELLVQDKRQERTEHVAADRGVGAVKERSRVERRLGGLEQRFDLKQVAVTQHRLQRGDPGVGAQHEDAVVARFFRELAGIDLERLP